MPIYFTSEGIAFANSPGARPSVYVRYDSLTRALSLVELPDQVVLGDLDGPYPNDPNNPNSDLAALIRATVTDLAVLRESAVANQTVDSKLQILNNENDSLVTAGGIEAQFIRVLSDKSRKTDFKKLPKMKNVLEQFSPWLYRYKCKSTTHAGIFAQDLLKDQITQNFVSKSEEGNLTVDFVSYLFCLVAGLKEEVKTLQEEIKSLK